MSRNIGNNVSQFQEWQLETPVIFLVFNRPSQTREVFARIAEARPRQLLVVADGPRRDRAEERALCEQVREIATAVTWRCELHTDFAADNLGCRRRVISGLDWAFGLVEEAIILEDDIVPDPSFFRFCEEMLARFRGDRRVSMITGFNNSADRAQTSHSYFFSEMTHVWGWATWRGAWATYDEHLTTWPAVRDSGLLAEIFPDRSAQRYWEAIFESMYRGDGPNTWDYQWMYTNLCQHALSVTPKVNLVRNIGFGTDATHSTNPDGAPKVHVERLQFPLQHPPTMIASRSLDAIDQEISEWHVPALPKRAVRKVSRMLTQRRVA